MSRLTSGTRNAFKGLVSKLPQLHDSTNSLRYSSTNAKTNDVSRLSRPLPAGTWDSHMHIVEPDRFPLHASAKYKPHPHTLADARAFYDPFGIQNMVIVQPSIYGNDNSCTLQALRDLTPKHGRAVIQFDPEAVSERELREWHELGVRGVRVNLVSVGREVTGLELRQELERYAKIIRPFHWVLQLYIPLKMATALEDVVPGLGVKVCIDHFGSPSLPDPYDPSKAIKPYDLSGFESVVRLLQKQTWVKISGQYRISKDPELRDLDSVGRELIKEAPNRVVYATDWPHTRFENIDSVPFIEMCYDWCGKGTGLTEKLFRSNAEELWDVR
jgi:predicted TIM-barrel fold metal-dependent hydrolase